MHFSYVWFFRFLSSFQLFLQVFKLSFFGNDSVKIVTQTST